MMHFDDVLQEKIKKGDLITRKDIVIGGNDIVIYRCETEFGTHGSEIKTLYKRSSKFHIFKYQYEKTFGGYRGRDDDSCGILSEDGEKIERIINDNMGNLKRLGKLEIGKDGITFDGTITDLYFSDLKQGVFFTYSVDNDINGKNMKILLDIQNKVEEMLDSIEKKGKKLKKW